MTEPKKPAKRGPGRPKLHKDTELVTFRCSTKMAVAIRGVLATLKLTSPQDMKTPVAVYIGQALKLRVAQLGNKRPDAMRTAIEKLDRVLVESYSHVER